MRHSDSKKRAHDTPSVPEGNTVTGLRGSVTPSPENAPAKPSPVSEGHIDRLKGMIESMPEIRQKKIQAIKRAVEEGRYYIDKDKLAKRVVEDAATDAVHRGKVGLERWPPIEE